MPDPTPPRVSVLVPASAAGARDLLASLDRQTLPAPAFEVLVGDDERSAELTTRLDDLVRHRTNVVRVPVTPDDAAAEAETLLARASGEHVVAMPEGRTLTSSALALLADRADATAADVVAGLTGRAGVRPEAPQDPTGPLPSTAGRLRRRAGVTAEDLAADLAGAPHEAAPGVVTELCFLDGTATEAGVPAEDAEPVAAADATWRDGVLHLTLVAPGTARLSVYAPASGLEWPLGPGTADGERVTFLLDPQDVPGVGPLPDGTWWPTVRVGDAGPALVEAAAARAHGATFRSRTTVSFSEDRRLGVDVGGRTRQPLRRLDPARTTVVEDSRGSLLTTPLRNIDLEPGARVTGSLRLGKMPVVAWLEDADGTGPVLRAWVSGLAGECNLQTRFSRAPYAPVGAQLVIDGVGTMTVAPVGKEPGPEAAPSPAAPEAAPGRARRLAGRALRSVRG